MTTPIRIRPESFGATVYDARSLGYFFINPRQLARLSAAQGGPVLAAATPVTGAGPAIDWSHGQFDSLLNSRTPVSLQLGTTPPPKHTLAAPIRVYFELTTRCNLRCDYCLNDSGLPRNNPLDTREILRTIRHLGRDGAFEVRLTGGEVALLQDLELMAREVHEQGMALSVNSNLLGPPAAMQRLRSLAPSLLITSLDADEISHGKARGRGYHEIVANIRWLREAGVPVRLNCALAAGTLEHVGAFIDQFAPLGCGFCFILLRPTGRAAAQFAPPALSDLMRCVAVIEAKRSVYPDCYFSTSFHVLMEDELVIGGINLTGCNAIQKSFNINSDGSVVPCAFLYELDKTSLTLGNIRETDYSVLPIWRESRLLARLREESAACNTRCIDCEHFKVDCLGSCAFMQIYSQRTGKPDPYCRLDLQSHQGCAPGLQK